MKHIFKKLHKASNSQEQPHRSNEPPSSSSSTTSGSQGVRATPISPPSRTVADPGHASSGRRTGDQVDYFSSEEEFQVQLALAISVSNSEHGVNTEKDQIRAATLLSLGGSGYGTINEEKRGLAADALSRKYWEYNVLDYDEKVIDGFYDVFSTSAVIEGKMPSLSDLEQNCENSGLEAVTVNQEVDPALEELMQIAQCIALDFPISNISTLVQQLAELVTAHMGGPVKDANTMLARWMEKGAELRSSLRTNVFPIGSISIGLSRHRALLFKALADSVKLPCRLVKGSHYTGVEDDAVNIIKWDDEREFLVDLMAAPGTLIPADILSAKDASLNSHDPSASKIAPLSSVVSGASYAKDSTLQGDGFTGDSSFDASFLFDKKLILGKDTREIPSSLGHAGGDSGVVPHCQTRSKENPFTELIPFQMEGNERSFSCHGSDNKIEELLRQKNFQLPVPLMWRNHHLSNQIPREKNYDPNNSNQSSPAFIDYVACEKTHPHWSKPSNFHTFSCVDADVEETKVNCKIENHCGRENLEIGADFMLMEHEDSRSDIHGCQQMGMLDKFMVAGHSDPLSGDAYVGECEIPWEDLIIGERIGLGSYGEVYHADWNGTEVAVKKFLDQDFSGAALDEFKREVRIMRRLHHPNVVRFMGAITRPPNLSIITEFLPRGSLYRILHRPHCQIDEKQRIKMALDVAGGMNCLHSSKPTIVHRDLKSPNLLVDNNWNVKVCDFGLSRLKHNTFLSSKSTAGTPEWMAPEVLRNEPSNEKCDVYSFGVILWELATLELPWSGMNPMQVVGAVGFQNRRLEIPHHLNPLVAKIISQCWLSDPNLRPSFAQLSEALNPLQCLVGQQDM